MKSHLRPFLCWGILLGGFLSSACADRSVVPPESPDTEFVSTGWLQGYQTTINGGTIAYHSPHPDATSALLVRSLDSRDHVEWETESVPDDFRGEAATFVWIFGMDVDSSPCSYDLFIDGKKWFRFANPRVSTRRDWQIEGPQGSRLRFRVTMVDRPAGGRADHSPGPSDYGPGVGRGDGAAGEHTRIRIQPHTCPPPSVRP